MKTGDYAGFAVERRKKEPLMGDTGDEVQELDAALGKRFLVIEIDDESGDVEWEDDGFAPWEILGIAETLRADALEALRDDDD